MKRKPTLTHGHVPRQRLGASAVELAIILPVLMTIVLGTVDIGRAFTTRCALANAVRVGAETGATHRLIPLTADAWEDRIRTAVLEELQGTPQLDLSQFSVQFESVELDPGRQRITVWGEVSFRTIVNWPGLSHHIPLTHAVSVEEHR